MQKQDAEALLRTALNIPTAEFRAGQWEAIDALVNRQRKLMVVQRTGWGKSSVYFISTRILRDRGAGPTLIVSPLLALMRNQVDAAQRLSIRAATINSANRDDWEAVMQQIRADQIDAVLISPERLANESFVNNVLLPLTGRIGLLVVDEAHCISDWGHDFRPDYRRLVNVIQQMPPDMPLLGTTATANNRVLDDVQTQFGDIEIQRGPLVRKSLVLQTMRMPDQPSRLAWLAHFIPKLPGAGIVYTLTTHDAEQVADWLTRQGIDARAYHGSITHPDFEDSNSYRQYLEDRLLNNELKVLVATSALGMGYDKPDLGFVIHYQAPDSVVSYYQQVGRAGRAIDRAYGILISGHEDGDIHQHFRQSAFPEAHEVDAILNLLAQHNEGLSIREINAELNMRYGQVEKALKVLSVENPPPIVKTGSKWQRTATPYQMDHARIQRLTSQRELEWQEVQDYINSSDCLMAYLRRALDDTDSAACGRCAVCRGKPVVSAQVDEAQAIAAARFLNQAELVFQPKKQVAANAFPTYGFRGNLPKNLLAEPGWILARRHGAGWGRKATQDEQAGRFRDELVEAMADMLGRQEALNAEWLTCVPSLRRPELVPDFARKLAARLQLPFVDVLSKVHDNEPQRRQLNRFYQCRNLDGAFIVSDQCPTGPVLLVDDVIDSGWTMTVLAALLKQAGSGPVYPVALLSGSSGE